MRRARRGFPAGRMGPPSSRGRRWQTRAGGASAPEARQRTQVDARASSHGAGAHRRTYASKRTQLEKCCTVRTRRPTSSHASRERRPRCVGQRPDLGNCQLERVPGGFLFMCDTVSRLRKRFAVEHKTSLKSVEHRPLCVLDRWTPCVWAFTCNASQHESTCGPEDHGAVRPTSRRGRRWGRSTGRRQQCPSDTEPYPTARAVSGRDR